MRMRSAASATLRMVSAGQLSSTAMSTMLIMIQERTVGTAAPDKQQIEQGRGERGARRPFADGKAQRDGRNERKPFPDQPDTVSAMITMCRPEIDRMSNRPELRIA